MTYNEELTKVLAYIDDSEASHFREDPQASHVYLAALIVDEATVNVMRKPIGARISYTVGKDKETEYISFGTADEETEIDKASGKPDRDVFEYTDGIAGIRRFLVSDKDGGVPKIEEIFYAQNA